MEWVQNYNPLASAFWSTLVAALPIVVLSGLLLAGVAAPRAAISGLITGQAVAVAAFKMPVSAALAAAGYGACFGLMPIGWIVLTAVFLYSLTVRSGQFEIVKHSVAAISPDRRMQALLIAFSFGSFLEGGAGFGAPVAISAALLIGLGFPPLYAAGLTLLANTSPVAFGSIGIPITTLAKVSGLNELALSQMAGRQLPFLSVIIPAWLIAVMSGWKGIQGAWPAILVCGGSFAVIQFFVSNFHGPALVDVLAGLGSLALLTIFLQFWRPKKIWRFPDERETGQAGENQGAGEQTLPESGPAARLTPTARQIAYAWIPWVLLSVMISLWGWPAWRGVLDTGFQATARAVCGVQATKVVVHGLHVYRSEPAEPVVPGTGRAAKSMDATYDFNLLSTSGTSVFLAAILAAFWLRVTPRTFLAEFLQTLFGVRWALVTIACMLALAYTMKFSGADVTLGLAFIHTGWFFPLFAPFLGWLGVVVTGSDTSSNAMFGSLQRVTAERLGLNPVLIVASNSTGGVMGKMIAAQSIVVAATATNQKGGEGRILRFVLLHSVLLATLVGLLTLLQAYVFPGMAPTFTPAPPPAASVLTAGHQG
ncbi:MAG: L-lactate permease [Thermoguttaceae bacterium]